MEDLIKKVFTDPAFMIVGAIIVVLVTLAIFKKLFKFVIILLLILILYAGYLYYTGEEAPESLKEAIEDQFCHHDPKNGHRRSDWWVHPGLRKLQRLPSKHLCLRKVIQRIKHEYTSTS